MDVALLVRAGFLTFALAACGAVADDSTCLGPARVEPLSGATVHAAEPAPLSPDEYLALHNVASTPKSAEWLGALQRLAASGDGFTRQHLQGLERAKLDAAQNVQLDAILEQIDARLPAETAVTVAASLPQRLERAAVADRRCDPLEGTIVPWTGASIAPFASAPQVRAELERLRTSFESKLEDPNERQLVTDRVRLFAEKLLAANPELGATCR